MPQLVSVGRLMGAGRRGSGGSTVPAWVLANSSLYVDFDNDRVYDGTTTTPAAILTPVRASVGTAQNLDSTWTSFTANQLRRTDQGLLSENASTNSIRNNTMTGAGAGVLPTNWVTTGIGIGTLTQTIVGTGTEGGIPYLEFRVNGTTSTTSFGYAFDANTQIVAATGQTWTNSFFCKLVSGSMTNITTVINSIAERTSVGGSVVSGSLNFTPTSAALYTQRIVHTRTLSGGGTVARVWPAVILSFSSGVAIDITLRVGWPQMEQSAIVTSPIPTTNAAVTRAADNITVSGAAAQSAIYAAKSAYSDTTACVFSTANVIVNINAALLQATSNTQIQTSNGTNTATATIGGAGTIASRVLSAFNFDGTNLTAVANAGSLATTAAAWGATSGTITVGNLAALNRAANGYISTLAFSATPSNYDALTGIASLRQVFTASRHQNAVSTSTAHQFQNRSPHIARDNITSLQIVLPGWYWNQSSHVETNAPNSIDYTASIEYPAGVLAGIFKFSGLDKGTCTAGSNLVSDVLTGLNIPTGARAWIWVWADGGAGFFVFNTPLATTGQPDWNVVDSLNGGAMKFGSGITDQTQTLGTLTATDAGQNGRGFWPLALIASSSKPAFMLTGDSRVFGIGDTIDSSGDVGEWARSIGQQWAYINLGSAGDSATDYIASHSKRAALKQYCSHVPVEFGINDCVAGDSLATIQGHLGTVYGYFSDKAVYQSTCHVSATSTDNWATTVNQTLNNATTMGVCNNLNTWILTTPAPLRGSFDVSGALTTSGVWSVTGSAFGYVVNSGHANQAGYLLIKSSGVINPATFPL